MLEETITRCETGLADPALFANDAAAFNTMAQSLETARQALAAAEEEWLQLEMQREEIEVSS